MLPIQSWDCARDLTLAEKLALQHFRNQADKLWSHFFFREPVFSLMINIDHFTKPEMTHDLDVTHDGKTCSRFDI